MASIAVHHAEWLSLVDVSGPFLSVPVLKEALPNGLDAHDPHVAAEVRAALEQWAEPIGDGVRSVDEGEVHLAFVQFVLHEVLGFDEDTLRWDDAATRATTVEVPHVGVLTPDAVVMDGEDPVMLVTVVGPGVRVDQITADLGTLNPQERMVEHLKATGLRVGLVTDGERWTLVSYREGENPGFATWWSSLWGEEKITLQAFRTLLHQDRFLTMGSDETIIGLLERSADDQREVTTKLGNQTLQAVEILIRTIDRIDHERGGELLRDVPVAELYDAAVSVMMRLIFLFYAEENELLPVAEPLYNERYAASTLRERLQAAADHHGEEILETTHDGWPRLLATWRSVFGGVEHGDMAIAPYGGSLFDPDRYPFLEGRRTHTNWSTDEADPLPIDNRTVLHLLNALQTLEEGGQRRKLSFRALDVEQIGHVYEGMLDHTAARAQGWVLGLSGTGGREPEIELSLLQSLDEKALFDFLKEQTGRSTATLKKWVSDEEADKAVTKFGISWATAFADAGIEIQARQFAKLIRPASTGAPTVFQPGSVYVADSSHRGATGTHYTPRSLTEEIVKHTLAPLVYIGPTEGAPEVEWELRTPEEILDLKICDPACGSGALLVQACRFIADAVVAAQRTHQRHVAKITEEEINEARRQVTERCLYGIDINPMACEMTKLSLWLLNLANDKPFSFLNHAIQCGDSLIGMVNTENGLTLRPNISSKQLNIIHSDEINNEEINSLKNEFCELLSSNKNTLDKNNNIKKSWESLLKQVAPILKMADQKTHTEWNLLAKESSEQLGHENAWPLRPFHWGIYKLFLGWQKIDAVIMNPPFLGGIDISGNLGTCYRRFLESTENKCPDRADLSAFFVSRASRLSKHSIGFIATSTISKGDTKRVGLQRAFKSGFRPNHARTRFSWPGKPNLYVSIVCMHKGWNVAASLNSEKAPSIGEDLDFEFRVQRWPERLPERENWSFEGWKPSGQGFILGEQEAADLLADPVERRVIDLYCSGEDIAQKNPPGPSRWIINFGRMSKLDAEKFPRSFKIVKERVYPRRSKTARRSHRERWWQYGETRPGLSRALKSINSAIVVPRVSKHAKPYRLSAEVVFSEQLVVLPTEKNWPIALLASSYGFAWIKVHSSFMGTGIRFTPTDSFSNLPFPRDTAELENAGNAYLDLVNTLLASTGRSMTDLFNLRDHGNPPGEPLRSLQSELDNAFLNAFNWSDLYESARNYHCSEFGYAPSTGAVREVISRLRELNFTERGLFL